MSAGSTPLPGTRAANAPSRAHLLAMMFVAILAISVAAPLLVTARMPASVVAFWRCLLAGLILFGWALYRERGALFALSRPDLARLAVAGTLLGIHFLLWFSSLAHTSILSSTVLVTTNPIWVAIGAWIFLREPSSRTTWFSIAIGIGGALLLAFADFSAPPVALDTAPAGLPSSPPALAAGADSLYGNALALGAALAGSIGLLIARTLRARIPYATFAAMDTLFAVPILTVAAILSGESFLPPTQVQLLCVVGLALGPQLIGNTALSWAVGWLPAPRVALVILGEPVGATLLAWALLDQTPTPLALAGGLLVMCAVLLAARQPLRPAGAPGRTIGRPAE